MKAGDEAEGGYANDPIGIVDCIINSVQNTVTISDGALRDYKARLLNAGEAVHVALDCKKHIECGATEEKWKRVAYCSLPGIRDDHWEPFYDSITWDKDMAVAVKCVDRKEDVNMESSKEPELKEDGAANDEDNFGADESEEEEEEEDEDDEEEKAGSVDVLSNKGVYFTFRVAKYYRGDLRIKSVTVPVDAKYCVSV